MASQPSGEGQAADQLDCVVIGADLVLGPFERDRQFADRAAFPTNLQVGVAAGVIGCDGDDDFVKEGVQELLTVLIGGGRRGPRSRSGRHRGPIPNSERSPSSTS
jgi:hypothetical protein